MVSRGSTSHSPNSQYLAFAEARVFVESDFVILIGEFAANSFGEKVNPRIQENSLARVIGVVPSVPLKARPD